MKLTSQMCSTFGSSWPAYFGNRFRCAESIRCHTVFTCEREHVECRPLIYDQDAARHSARRGDIGYSCETPHAPRGPAIAIPLERTAETIMLHVRMRNVESRFYGLDGRCSAISRCSTARSAPGKW